MKDISSSTLKKVAIVAFFVMATTLVCVFVIKYVLASRQAAQTVVTPREAMPPTQEEIRRQLDALAKNASTTGDRPKPPSPTEIKAQIDALAKESPAGTPLPKTPSVAGIQAQLSKLAQPSSNK